jgi:hypothetical protein
MEDFNLKYWWNLLGAAGAAIAVASVTAQFVPGFAIGLGLLFFGAGEWVNHPRRTEIVRGEMPGSYITTRSNPWKPKPFGLLLDAVGIGLFGFGVFRLVVLAP